MKRTLLIVAVLVIVVSAGAWLFARTSRERNAQAFQRAREVDIVSGVAVRSDSRPHGFRAVDGSTDVSNLIARRKRFIGLAMQKAELLKESELSREIAALEGEVKQLDAEDKALAKEYDGWNRATEAIEVLQTISAQDSGTKAAEAANAAIDLLQERRNRAEHLEPVANPVPPQKSPEPARTKPALK
jgi:thioredoxin-like negative regulator of GroEL